VRVRADTPRTPKKIRPFHLVLVIARAVAESER
jgi:hypothetical protein